MIAPTVVRLDTSIVRYEDRSASTGLGAASLLTASYRIPGTGPQGAGLAPLLRVALAADSPPSGTGGLALVNPLVGAGYAVKLDGGFRLNAFLMNRTHLNARVVSETIAPMVEQARCALMSSDRQSRAFVDTVLVALRDFDDAL